MFSGLQPSEVLTELEDLQPLTWLVNESWLSAGCLSLGLLECPHNMAADRPQGWWSKRARKKLQCLF